jgi:hypothetical protein
MWSTGEMILTEGNRYDCLSDTLSITIPHGLIRDRTRASAVRGRGLPSWAMAHPRKISMVYLEQGDLSALPDYCSRVSFNHVDSKNYKRNLKYETQF